LAVGTTESAVAAIYNATATASETTTLVVGDGTNTVTVPSASYTSIADQVTAIQGGTGYSDLLFTVHENSTSNGIEFRYKTAGSVASTPTFTGTGTTHTITNPTVGVSVATPVAGVAAKYNVTGTVSETTDLKVSDGTTTVSVDPASYTSIAQQVTAIQSGAGYSNLKFTVAANDTDDGFIFTYKTSGAVTAAPTLTGSGSSHTVSTNIAGVTSVNAATTTTINVSSDTPAGIVSAINGSNTGVTATLVDTGTGSNSFRIMLAGQTGKNGVFTLTSNPDLGFHDSANSLQSAQDAILSYEGLTVTRSSNTIDDVIGGATINLMSTSTSDVRLTITNDRSTLKSNIQAMVSTYNDLLSLFNEISDEETGTEFSGALSDDSSLVRYLTNKIHSTVFADSSTASGDISALRSLGLSMSQYGKITFTEGTFDAAVVSNYDDIVTMLTADSSNENIYASGNKGLAQDIMSVLEDLTDSTGIVTLREATAKSEKSGHEEALINLEKRMDVIYNRYLAQFNAMEGLMATLDSTKDYLTSQFETLSKAYDSD
jgi:flagellar hook-associated protein 2